MSKKKRYVRFVRIGLTEADEVALAYLPKDGFTPQKWWLRVALSEALHAYADADEEGLSPFCMRLKCDPAGGRRGAAKEKEMEELGNLLDSLTESGVEGGT
jgi:hypothetical protein